MLNNNNYFSDFMKSFMNPELYATAAKNIPAVDFSSLNDVAKKATKIMTTTNQIAAESAQSLLTKSAEGLQKSTTHILNNAAKAAGSGDIRQIAEYQQQCLKYAYEASVHNTKELMNIASESSKKILEVFNQNIAEQFAKTTA